MDTSGSGASSLLYAALLVATLSAAGAALGDLGPWLRSPRPAAWGLWVAVAVPSVVGLTVPAVYAALSRDPASVRDGQWWRLLTAATVQDGGVVGAAVNLVALALVGTLAVHLMGGARAVTLFVVGAVAFNLVAVLASGPPGAGNSGATFLLAAATVAMLVVRRRSPRVLVAGAVVLVVGVVLLLLRDAHGETVVAGLVVGPFVGPALGPGRYPGSRAARGSE